MKKTSMGRVDALHVESTRVQTLSTGQKIIDVTVRRASSDQDAKLVLPQFDDDSSSSEDDDDSPHGRHDFVDKQEDDGGDVDEDAGNEENNPVFQGEFQWYGVQDIQELTHTNAQLQEQVRELKNQVKTLQIQLEAMAPVPGLNVAAVQDILLDKDATEHDIRDAKIVHQAKTLRHLKRTVQREKQLAVDAAKQCKQMEATKQQLEQENETLKLKLSRFQARAAAVAVPKTQQDECPTSSEPAVVSKDAYKKRFDELRSKFEKLQVDLKKTQRALQREVGDDVSIEELVENTSQKSGKRSRAQQIVMLKAKVKKLEADLARVAGDSSSTTSNDVDQRAQQELVAQHAQRQKALDRLTVERDELQEKVQQLTKKFDALKSRTQILEKEKQDTKSKIQLLVDKSRNDDALVDALQKQLETWKGKLQEAKRARTADSGGGGSGSTLGGGLPKDERMELDRLRATVADYKRHTQNSERMPTPSEVSQYRAMASERERLLEVNRALQAQLEEKEHQINSLKTSTSPPEQLPASRIPRLFPGSRAHPTPPAAPSDYSQALETLRKTFRDSMATKEQEIEALKVQIQQLRATGSSTNHDDTQWKEEIQDLQDENAFLRQEFDRLKTRYESLLKTNSTSRTNGK
ncbi:hypothetical protein Poli38472_000207 [Pythium oligandrum]|uniref:Uncharacterized protein n=1 Tax=Pythium oligandrum TaxID=41045 RepID=A0A8K1FE56_PYTOL|nr:hypothetical protein Poli38472_000207 [Pythium oligandrum]|eukprot:TMW60165.1 hypothetical protein Poli38472_000207 [Pythium oligandrum]